MNGLRSVANSHADAVLEEVAPAFWQREAAARHTRDLLERHPETNVIWAASDNMAAGAVEAIRESGRKPGVDVLVGGIDWSPFVREMIEDGEVAVSLGGHFLDGAWSIVMLFDHHRGEEFEVGISQSKYEVLTKENRSRYLAYFDES